MGTSVPGHWPPCRRIRATWQTSQSTSIFLGSLRSHSVCIASPLVHRISRLHLFTAGQQIAFNVTVRQHGNGTEVPTHISLKHSLCQNLTWAASYAHSEDLRDMTSGCQAAEYYGPSDSRLTKVSPFDPEGFQHHSKERRRSFGGLTHSGGISTSTWIWGRNSTTEPR